MEEGWRGLAFEPEQFRLNDENLPRINASVRTPAYDRRALEQPIVHIGVGGFHRAHQAVYLDDLLHLPDEPRWAECGLGVLPSDDRMRDALLGQDCLYTVVERSAAGETARVIGSIAGYLHAPGDPERAIEKLAAAGTRIVSLTITEGGYFLDEGTGRFNPDHPEIRRDLEHPDAPRTSFGYIAAALDRRRLRGLLPFTLMSCDNLQSNGEITRSVLHTYAELKDPALAAWIAEHMSFPNSMVDRITPGTTDADREAVRAHYGFRDDWPVMTEPFLQWVIEDHFSQGRPRWEKVGAQVVSDVAPYEMMKIRLLNGSHMAIAYLGALAGFTYVHEILADPLFLRFVRRFMEEVTPVVPAIPGTSIPEYKATLVERFANPAIRDQVTRICSEGSAKVPKWLLPSIVELLAQGRSIHLLSLVVASWIHYLKTGVDERGQALEILDARAEILRQTAATVAADPRPMLALSFVFGQALPANPRFVQGVEEALRLLSTEGVTATMQHYLTGEQQTS